MKNYTIEVELKKVEGDNINNITLTFETRVESFDAAFMKAQRYYTIAQAEEGAEGKRIEVWERQ